VFKNWDIACFTHTGLEKICQNLGYLQEKNFQQNSLTALR